MREGLFLLVSNTGVLLWPRRILHSALVPILLLTCLIGISGCTEKNSEPARISEHETLSQRISARWEALIAGEWEKAYSFESPAYREIYNLGQFARRFGGAVTWHRVKLEKLEIDEASSRADIRVVLYYTNSRSPAGASPVPAKLDETWVKRDGVWWYLHKTNKLLQNKQR